MEMQGSRGLAVTQAQAWEALNDPEVLKASIPGCDKVEPAGENQYTVGVAVKVGPVAAKFNGKITLSEVQPPESYTLSFDGQGGAAGFGKGQAQVKLTPQGTGCELSYSVRAQVGGKIAQVGQRLIDGVARSSFDPADVDDVGGSTKRWNAGIRRLMPLPRQYSLRRRQQPPPGQAGFRPGR